MNNTFLMPEKNEDKLIIYASRSKINDQTKNKIKDLIREDIDWNYLIISACRNEVPRFFYSQIINISPENVPKYFLNSLKDDFNRGVKYNLFLTAELMKVMKLFKSHNIPAIPYTGPTLNYQIYGNITSKEIYWIDIIIDEKDVEKSKEILLSMGYELKFQPGPQKEKAFIKYVQEYVFTKDGDLVLIHLRWNYFKDYFSSPNRIDGIWDHEKMNSIVINGFELLNPSVEELFLILCIESAKRQWTRLGYICDIAELVRSNDNLDWNKILNTSQKFRILKIVILNLYLINELFDVKIPIDLSNQVNDEIKDISMKIMKIMFTHNDYLIKMRRENQVDPVLRFKSREHKYDGIKDFLHNLTPSSPYKTYKPSTTLSRITDSVNKPIQFLKVKFLNRYPTILVPEPYVLTPTKVIMKMLEMAEVGPEDVVYDLGCGNGKIITTAAEKFGVRAVGVDLDAERIKQSRDNAKKKGVEDLTTFIEQDMMKTDISNATIVIIYHIPSINLVIRSKLQKELKPILVSLLGNLVWANGIRLKLKLYQMKG